MSRWEIINPSDAAFFETDDFELAAALTLLLGQGKYGAAELGVEEPREVPIFLFGGSDQWIEANFGTDLESFFQKLDARDEDLAVAFDTVRLGGERSSLNDIVGRAEAYAKALRGRAAKGAA